MKVLIFGVILAMCSIELICSVQVDTQSIIKVCYTQWFDRDDPSGKGDYETLNELRAEFPGKICLKPLSIEVQTLSGVPATSTGQVFSAFDTVTGFACVNINQKNGCLDYKVRFRCPCFELPNPILAAV